MHTWARSATVLGAHGLDFASTGHLTVTRCTPQRHHRDLRLERLGIERSMMPTPFYASWRRAPQTPLSVCPLGRPITEEERGVLHPAQTHTRGGRASVGCPACRDGYRGRVGVHEVLDFDRRRRELDPRRRPHQRLPDAAFRARGSIADDSAIDKVRSFDLRSPTSTSPCLSRKSPRMKPALQRRVAPVGHLEAELEKKRKSASPSRSRRRPTFRRPWGSRPGRRMEKRPVKDSSSVYRRRSIARVCSPQDDEPTHPRLSQRAPKCRTTMFHLPSTVWRACAIHEGPSTSSSRTSTCWLTGSGARRLPTRASRLRDHVDRLSRSAGMKRRPLQLAQAMDSRAQAGAQRRSDCCG